MEIWPFIEGKPLTTFGQPTIIRREQTVRVADDCCADASLSKTISQTAEHGNDVYFKSFPQPATVVFSRFERDQVGPGHWWTFCELRLPRGQGRAWIRYFAGPMRPEPGCATEIGRASCRERV